MKKYFVLRGDFGNTYDLCYTDNGTHPDGWEQITRKKAESLARAEAYRRRDEPYSSGYAPSYVMPHRSCKCLYGKFDEFHDGEMLLDCAMNRRYGWRLSGRVVERD